MAAFGHTKIDDLSPTLGRYLPFSQRAPSVRFDPLEALHAKIGELTLVNDFCPVRSAQDRNGAGLLPSAKR